jgi:hypothetical protein
MLPIFITLYPVKYNTSTPAFLLKEANLAKAKCNKWWCYRMGYFSIWYIVAVLAHYDTVNTYYRLKEDLVYNLSNILLISSILLV